MAKKKEHKNYICTHQLTVNGEAVKAGTPISSNHLSAKTIKQYTEGGILSEYKIITDAEIDAQENTSTED